MVGLGFGDETKGATVDWLCANTQVDCVIKPSSGCQTAHNVVTGDGRHHTFAQFGSGTLRDVPTYLGPEFMVEPLALVREAEHLALLGVSPWELLWVDPECLVTTPYHKLVNLGRSEASVHGTCGRGIGETARYGRYRPYNDAVRVKDLSDDALLRRKLALVQVWADMECPDQEWPSVREVAQELHRASADMFLTTREWVRDLYFKRNCVWEYSQGVLLDEYLGFHPHTTWATVHPWFPRILGVPLHVIGVTRSYATRHGPGPFPSEVGAPIWHEAHNEHDGHQGRFRTGYLDLVMLKYATKAAGPFDSVAVSHMDVPSAEVVVAYLDTQAGGYLWELERDDFHQGDTVLPHQERLTERLGNCVPVKVPAPNSDGLRALIEAAVGAPVGLEAVGPTEADRSLLCGSSLERVLEALDNESTAAV